MGLIHSPKIVTDGLILCLDPASKRSYTGAGTAWTNLINSKNGTLVNGPTFSTEGGGSIHLDGANDKATYTLDSNIGTSDFTILVWMKIMGNDTYSHIMAFTDQNMFAFKAGNINYGPNDIYFYGGSSYRSLADDFGHWAFTLNAWTMFGLSRTSTGLTGYNNGEKLGTHSESSAKDITSDSVQIGWGWGGEYTEQYRGPTYLYNKALSEEEVLQNYKATRGRFQ